MKNTIFIILMLSLFSCDQMDCGLRVVNLTNDTIVFDYLTNDKINLVIDFYRLNKDDAYVLLPLEYKVLCNPATWKGYISICEDSSLVFFVYKKSDLEKIPWDTIKTSEKYYKIYKIKSSQLDSLNGVFNIPRSTNIP